MHGAPAPRLTEIPYPVLWAAGLFVPLVRELRLTRYQFTAPFVVAAATAFDQNTCNGCHGGRTDPSDVPFQHVAPPAGMSYCGSAKAYASAVLAESSLPVVIAGAGPAGLATAGALKQRGIQALVLEAGPSLATSWRNHYDRLHLHTVRQQSHLPGLALDKTLPRYVSRADFVAYLESYAARFSIAPRTGEPVRRVAADAGGLVVESAGGTQRARAVVVATGFNRRPNPERLPDQQRFHGTLLHSSAYRNADAFAGQRVLVVGAGNTGAEIALDLAEHGARPVLAVRSPVNVVPRDLLGMPIQLTSIRLQHAPLAVADGIGRLASWLAFGNLARHGFPRAPMGPISAIRKRRRIPLIDVGTIAAVKQGKIAVKPGVVRLTETGALFDDQSTAELDAVVLATGFRAALEEIVDVPGALDADGTPRDWRGGGACPNLFFVGYEIEPTGQIRQIARRAQAVAAEIAGAPSAAGQAAARGAD